MRQGSLCGVLIRAGLGPDEALPVAVVPPALTVGDLPCLVRMTPLCRVDGSLPYLRAAVGHQRPLVASFNTQPLSDEGGLPASSTANPLPRAGAARPRAHCP